MQKPFSSPLWYNDRLKLQVRKGWIEKGIIFIWDILDLNRPPLSQVEFEEKYNIKTNFLGYGTLCRTITNYPHSNDMPDFNPCFPFEYDNINGWRRCVQYISDFKR